MAESLFAEGYLRCVQTRARQGPPSGAPRHTRMPKTKTKATLLLGRGVPVQEPPRSRETIMQMYAKQLARSRSSRNEPLLVNKHLMSTY